jgi:hypothetical protein
VQRSRGERRTSGAAERYKGNVSRTTPAGFIETRLPSSADRPPSGPDWVHEIKHDAYRLMARRDPVGYRLLTRNGHWAPRYPLIVEAFDDTLAGYRRAARRTVLHWILSRLAAYIAVVVAVGLLFLAGASVYALMWPKPVVPFGQMGH